MPFNVDPITFLQGLAYLGLILLLGYAVLCLVRLPGVVHWVELISLSFAAGAGVLSLLLFDLSVAGFKPGRGILISIAIVAIASISFRWKPKGLLRPSVPSRRNRIDPLGLLGLLSGALLVTAAGNIIAHAGWPGLQDIDAFAIWMLKAKMVAPDALRPMPPAFRDPILSYTHQDYPLCLPFLAAGFYSAIGRIDDSAAKLLLLPIWSSLVGIIYAAVRRMHRRATALIITAIFATAPTLSSNASLLVAETTLILMLTATATQLVCWIETDETDALILTGLFAAAAAFCKNEGLALLPIVGLMTLILSLLRRSIKPWLIAAATSLITIGPWLIYRKQLPKTHEDYGSKLHSVSLFAHNLSERHSIIAEYLGRFFDAPRAGLIWYLLLITTVLSPKSLLRTATRVLWLLLLVQLSLYLATFIVTPWDVDVLLPMITPKLQTQASALAALLIALNLRNMRWPANQVLNKNGSKPTQAGL